MLLMVLMLPFLGWIAYLQFSLRSLIKKNQTLFAEVKTGDVVQILNAALKELDELNQKVNALKKEHEATDIIAKNSLNKLGILRFNPFNDTGGDQSFSLGFLNHHDNGVVITSIHGRDGDRIYSKPIIEGSSTYSLADEEKEVIKIATNTKSHHKGDWPVSPSSSHNRPPKGKR